MSNRLIGVLIILSFIVVGFFYWTFVYVPNKIEKDRELETSIENEKKEIKLSKVDIEKKEEKIISNEEKIEKLKLNKIYYKIIDLGENKFYFSKKDNLLELNLNDKLVGNFDLVPEAKINIQKIYTSDNDFYIMLGNKKYIYSNLTDILFDIDLNVDVNYIKRSDEVYIINTIKGSYIFDKTDKSLEYFTFFEDFVYYKDSYVGIIKKDDDRRIKNLGITFLDENSIYFYNPKTKEKKSLYNTDLKLEKIYIENAEIYFIDSSKGVYKLENLEYNNQ